METVQAKASFPIDRNSLALVPANTGGEGLGSYLVIMPTERVPQSTDSGTNPATFSPISAAGIRQSFQGGPSPSNTPQYSYNNGTSRCSFWLAAIINRSNDPTVLPPLMSFQIRAASSCINEIVAQGTFQPTSFSETGLIVAVQGLLCTQWEFWAKVRPEDIPPPAVDIRLHIMFDRIGVQDFQVEADTTQDSNRIMVVGGKGNSLGVTIVSL